MESSRAKLDDDDDGDDDALERGEYLADIIDACYGDIPLYRAREKHARTSAKSNRFQRAVSQFIA